MAVTAIPVGLALGLSLGLLGGGGSVLALPLLVYVVGEDVQAATTTSLMVVAVAAIGGLARHARSQRVCWSHAAAFTAAALPGIVVGTAAGGGVSERVLVAGFAFVMLAAAPAIWRAGCRPEDPCEEPRCPPLRLAPTIAAGALIGGLTGFFGIGGGFLIVPTLIAALALPMRMAVGTSLSIIAATALLGLAAHAGAGREVDLAVTVAVSAASVLGAVAGAGLTGLVPRRRLAQGFSGLVVAVAGYLLLSATVIGLP